jgi:hypothetical protein
VLRTNRRRALHMCQLSEVIVGCRVLADSFVYAQAELNVPTEVVIGCPGFLRSEKWIETLEFVLGSIIMHRHKTISPGRLLGGP